MWCGLIDSMGYGVWGMGYGVWYGIVCHGIARHGMVSYCIVRYCMVYNHGTALYNRQNYLYLCRVKTPPTSEHE